MKRIAIVAAFCFSISASAQVDNMLYAKQFPGQDVGTKITNALAACNSNPALQCTIVIDSSLAGYNQGSMPLLAPNVNIIDYRNGFALSGPFSAGSVNSIINVDSQPGSDIGAKINAAVVACGPGPCAYSVQKSGTISTPPDLPMGSYLNFSPNGIYTLSTTWKIAHRHVTIEANGATFYYTPTTGTAFYVGKGIAPVVSVAANSTTVNWVSGPDFSTVDEGDQIAVNSGVNAPFAANVCAIPSKTQLTLCAPLSSSTITSQPSNFSTYAYPAVDSDIGDVIKDLLVVSDNGVGNGTGLTVELSSLTTHGFRAQSFAGPNGTCLSILGAISGTYYDTQCNLDSNNIVISDNSIGGFFVSYGNSNIFMGAGITSCTSTSGSATLIRGSSQNHFYGLHEEGCKAHIVNKIQHVSDTGYPASFGDSFGNQFYLADFERNGDNAAGSADFSLLDYTSGTLITGGPMTSTYSGSGSGLGTQTGILAASTTSATHLSDLSFAGNYAAAYNFSPGSTCTITNSVNVGTSTGCAFTLQPEGVLYPGLTLENPSATSSGTGTFLNGNLGPYSGAGLEFYWNSSNTAGVKLWCMYGFNTASLCETIDPSGNAVVPGSYAAPKIIDSGESSYSGFAACYTSGGTLGHCTSAVAAGGTCSCI